MVVSIWSLQRVRAGGDPAVQIMNSLSVLFVFCKGKAIKCSRDAQGVPNRVIRVSAALIALKRNYPDRGAGDERGCMWHSHD